MAGGVPAGRAAHSACLIEPGGSIVVFGGTNGQRPFDELWLLHVGSSRWEQLRLRPLHKRPRAVRKALLDHLELTEVDRLLLDEHWPGLGLATLTL